MKIIPMAMVMVIAACGSSAQPLSDASGYGPHDQVTVCDPMWSSTSTPPAVCDHACALRPLHTPCSDKTRPCYSSGPCTGASSPSAPTMDCAVTFGAGDGILGCCALKESIMGQFVPIFFECPR